MGCRDSTSSNDQGVATDALTGTLTIVHTNDIHGYYTYDARNGSMGFAYFQALITQENPDLILDAGDTFHGQSFATVTEGKSIAQLMNSVKFDATTPGNHDWSYGAQTLQGLDDGQSFSILAANVIGSATGQPAFDEYITKEVEVSLSDGSTEMVTVGVLGVIDESFYTSTPAQNIEGLTFVDPVQRANEVAQSMRENGCDLVVALTHNEDPQEFARQTQGIDAVIAGHEHVLIDETVNNAEGDTVSVVEAGHYFQYAGGIRGGIYAGEVTADDLLSISPYGNTIATYTLTGQEVKDTLEHSLEIMAQYRAGLAKQMGAIENGEDLL